MKEKIKNNMREKLKNKKVMILIVGFILLVLVGIFLFIKFNNTDKDHISVTYKPNSKIEYKIRKVENLMMFKFSTFLFSLINFYPTI